MKALRICVAAVAAIVVVLFTASFVMIFWNDPQFAPLPKMSAADMAAFAARFAQPYPAAKRAFKMRDGTNLASQSFSGTSNTTIVLVHGVMSSGSMLNHTSGLLHEATGAEVIAVDLRGHGASGGAPGDVAYIGQYEDDIADVVTRVRSAKPGGRVILAGHSMGGGIALRYAMNASVAPVDGYLLFAPHMGLKSPTMRTESGGAAAAFMKVHLPRILGLAFLNSVGIRAFNGLQALFFNLPPEVPLRSYTYRAMAGMAPDDYVPAVAAIHKPLLVVVGSRDEAFRAEAFEGAIGRKGEVVILDGASHDGALTDPRTMAVVGRWLGAAQTSAN